MDVRSAIQRRTDTREIRRRIVTGFTSICDRYIVWRVKIFLLSCLILSLPLVACAPSGGSGTSGRHGQGQAGIDKSPRLSVFLNLKGPSGPAVWLRISAIEILAGDVLVPLISDPLEIDAAEIGRGQILIANRPLPPGSYDSIRITINKAAIHRKDKMVLLAIQEPELVVPIFPGINLKRHDSTSLFITWDVKASIVETAFIEPAMVAAPQSIPLVADLAYVACPDIDTIYVLRTDKNRVCGTLGVSGQPTYPVLDTSRNRLYVLATGESAIKVIELSNNRLVDIIQIPLTHEPGFMTLSPDGLWAYILDERGNYVIRMDLQSGSLAKRVRLGQRPQYAAYLPDQHRLAVSSSLSQAVFLLDPMTLTTMEAVPVGSSPQGLVAWNHLLYIAESGSNTVSIYDLDAKQMRGRINVGPSPGRLLLSRDHIYVSTYAGGSVSVLLPGQLSVMKKIPVGNAPLEMVSSVGRRWLYVGNQKSQDLTVIDLTSNRVWGTIALGASPLGLAVVE